MQQETEREFLDRRFSELKPLRHSTEQRWWDILDQILPYRVARQGSRKNRKGRDEAMHSHLLNSTPVLASRTMGAGLLASGTSPATPWFGIRAVSQALREIQAVSVWQRQVEDIIYLTFLRGGLYQALADTVYKDLPGVGTASISVEEDDEVSVRYEGQQLGEYWIDVDTRKRVDTYFLSRWWTAQQVVDRFGFHNVTDQTREKVTSGHGNDTLEVIHAILPNHHRVPGSPFHDGMAFVDYWFEAGGKGKGPRDGILESSGFEEMPHLVPRWGATKVYGVECPGWLAVGDCKSLQHNELKLAGMIDKSNDPPMVAVKAMKGTRLSLVPGDVTFAPDGQHQAFRPAMEIQPHAIAATEKHINRHELRINRAYLVDLWMAMLSDTRAQPRTAEEIRRTSDEVMLQLGPWLTSLNDHLLDPLVERTFRILQRRGELPDPPEELEDAPLEIEYISPLHQAQKLTRITGIRELVSTAVGLAQVDQTALDKIAVDEVIDEVAEILNVRPELVRSEDQVRTWRQAKAEQARAQQENEAAVMASQVAANASKVDPQTLGDLASLVTPAAAAQGGLQ